VKTSNDTAVAAKQTQSRNKGSGVFYFIKKGFTDYLRPYSREQVVILLTVIALVGFEISLPLCLKYLIDTVLVERSLELLIQVLLFLTVIVVVAALAHWWQTHVSIHFGDALSKDLRQRFFVSIQNLPTRELDTMQPGALMSLFTKELNRVIGAYAKMTQEGSRSIIRLTAILITLFILNWQIGLVVSLFVPLLFFIPNRFLKRSIYAGRQSSREKSQMDSALQDNIATQPLIRAFGLNNKAAEQFSRDILQIEEQPAAYNSKQEIRETAGSFRFLLAMVSVSANIQQYIINALVIAVGAYMVFNGTLTLGGFSGVILLIPKVGNSTVGLSNFLRSLVQATNGLHRVEKLFDAGKPKQSSVVEQHPDTLEALAVESVGFSYKPELQVLNNLNLSLAHRQSVALLGRSGSGKSTFFKLLAGFYEPGNGSIKVNGLDMWQYDHEVIGRICGVVFQDNNLVNGTIRDNIALIKPNASDAEIEAAARTVGVHELVQQLPQGYDTPVGEQGKLLASGARKRIALARAVLHKPKLLLLDDLSAEMDPESEEAINHIIRALSKQCAVVYSTHRLSSALLADTIAVLDRGEICEMGSHEDLLAKKGIYYQFWQLQTGFSITDDGRHAEVTGERLQRIPLFSRLDASSLEGLSQRFKSEYYNEGHVIYREGDRDFKFYILVRGLVSITALNASQREVQLATLQDGDYFGEMEMFNRGFRGTTVTTKSPVLCLTLEADVFEEVMKEFASLHQVMRQMALGRSLTTLSSVGRRGRKHPVWQQLIEHQWDSPSINT
jgi:ATP-binding cassette subfamily B protein